MSLRSLIRLLLGYAIVLVVACLVVHSSATMSELSPAETRVVITTWQGGHRLARTSTKAGETAPTTPASEPGATTVRETIVGEAPLWSGRWPITFGLVPGRDGIEAQLGEKTAWLTVDDLLSAEAYDHAGQFLDASLGMGTHYAHVIHLLATDFGVTPAEVEERAHIKRVRFVRSVVGEKAEPRITGATLDENTVKMGVRAAALYLARSVDDAGRYRYLVDAITNVPLTGYSWPRHAGATYFLAQAAAVLDDAEIRFACLRAAAHMRDDLLVACGTQKCIADDDQADVGSSALALVAFSEIVRTGLDASYRPSIAALAKFLRSQQRADGELMHVYDRTNQKPINVQYLYFTGEAALGLARAHRITGDPEDLNAASRALARLAGDGWGFFGSRYYFSEEHWTCQAVEDLWERAPDPKALDFCLRWHEYQRKLQHSDGDSAFDADGSFGFGPFITPRVTPASSRGEAAGAALAVLKRDALAGAASADEHAETVTLLDDELRRAIAFVLRAQLRPGPRHLFARPDLIDGAMPGSDVDLQLRIDYVQHAGSMMIRWLDLNREPSH